MTKTQILNEIEIFEQNKEERYAEFLQEIYGDIFGFSAADTLKKLDCVQYEVGYNEFVSSERQRLEQAKKIFKY